MLRHSLPMLVVFAACCWTPTAVRAQTNQQLTLIPWSQDWFGETNDRPLVQFKSHVKDEDAHASVFWWDSTGRFRFDKNDPAPLAIGYRWLTMNFDTDSRQVPDHLDEISLAAAFHLGDPQSADIGIVLGAGYSSNNPFADTNGIFGIGHITCRRPLSERDALIVSVDYNGNSSFLPDVPLPGLAYEHRDKPFSFAVGFPDSWIEWNITPDLAFDARYSVPFSAEATLEYHLTKNFSVLGGVANFFNGFAQDDEPVNNRIFYQMSRVEAGIRFRNPSFWKGFYVDISLLGGYAFNQRFSHGFDVRDLDTFTSISDEPYIGLLIIGRL